MPRAAAERADNERTLKIGTRATIAALRHLSFVMPTPDRPQVPAADELLRHAHWMRALARSLVRDDATADDVTQDAWVVALARPPRTLTKLRGWLAAVIRSVVLQRARGESRRRRREQAAATHEALDATDDVVSRAGIHRRLVDAVLELDEPYRSTLLLRFFDGLAPRAIAERKGLPDATVRSHLKRGLDRLRERFDAEHRGDRGAWIALIAPLAHGGVGAVGAASGGATVAASATGKAAFMTSTTKLALAGAIVLAAGAGWFASRRGTTKLTPAPTPVDAGKRDGDRPIAPPSAVAEAGIARPAHAEANSFDRSLPKRTSEALPVEPVHFVYGSLLDTDGRPVTDAYVSVSSLSANDDVEPSRARPWESHEDKGSFAIAGLRPGGWRLQASAAGYGSLTREFTLEESPEGARVDLVLTRQIKIPIRLRAPDGRALVDAVARDDPDVPLFALAVIALPDAPPARLPLTSGCNYDGWSLARWHAPSNGPFVRAGGDDPPVPKEVDGLLLLDRARPFHAIATWKNVVLSETFVADPEHLDRPLELVVDPAAITASLATVRVHCINGDASRPAAGLKLYLSDAQGWGRADTKTDADGIATFTHVAPGLLTCMFGPLEFLAPVEPGGLTDLGTIDVKPAAPVEGRVVDEQGRLLKLGVAWIDVGRWTHGQVLDYCASTYCDQDGVFHLSLGRSRYLLRSYDADRAFSPVLVDLTTDSVAPLEIRLVPGTLVTFDLSSGFPLLPTNFEIDRADGSVVDSSAGPREIRLVPGAYRMTVRREGAVLANVAFDVGGQPIHVKIPALEGPARDAPTHDGDENAPGSGSVTDSLRASDPIGQVLFGRIGGAPLQEFAEGWFTAIDSSNVRRDSRLHRGCFALSGLAAGHQELLVIGSTRLPYREWFDLPVSAAPTRHDFNLAPALRIAVRLVDARTRKPIEQIPAKLGLGHGLPRLDVVVTKEPPTPGASLRRSDAGEFAGQGGDRFHWRNGESFFALRDRGSLEISSDLPLFVSLVCGERVLHTEPLAAPIERLDLPLDWEALRAADCSLRVRLVDATTGAALDPAGLAVRPLDFGFDRVHNEAKSLDQDGTFELTGLAATECKLIVVVPDHERIEHSLTLAPGVVNDLGTLELGAPHEVHGRVVDSDGGPVKCTLMVRDGGRSERPLPLTSDLRAFSGEDGAFSFALGRGPHVVAIEDERFAATSRLVDAASSKLDDLQIVLRQGTPVAIRLDPPSAACETITIEDENGTEVASRRVRGFTYRLRLAPGRYIARGRNGTGECGVVDFEVQRAPLEVVLKP